VEGEVGVGMRNKLLAESLHVESNGKSSID